MTSLILYKFPFFISTVQLKSGIIFSQFLLNSKLEFLNVGDLMLHLKLSKIGIFECCSNWTSQFFQINERDAKLDCLKITLVSISKYLPIHQRPEKNVVAVCEIRECYSTCRKRIECFDKKNTSRNTATYMMELPATNVYSCTLL